MSIMIISDVNYDGLCGSLCLCGVYFISLLFRDWYQEEETNSFNLTKSEEAEVAL